MISINKFSILPFEAIAMTVERLLCSHAVTNNAYSFQSSTPLFWSLLYSPCIALCPLLIPCTRRAAPIFKSGFLSRAYSIYSFSFAACSREICMKSIRAAAAAELLRRSLEPCVRPLSLRPSFN
jgi:hypothetical protein